MNTEQITIEVTAEMLADASAFAGYLMKQQLETNTVTIDQWEIALSACRNALDVYWEQQKAQAIETSASQAEVGQ